MKKVKVPTCITYLLIALIVLIGFFFIGILRYNNIPDAVGWTVNVLEPVWLGLGAVVLLLAGIFCFFYITEVIQEWNLKKLRRISKEYPVRSAVIRMVKTNRYDFIPVNLSEEPGQGTAVPIYFTATITNHGLCITENYRTNQESIITTVDGAPFGVFNRGRSDPVTIPLRYIHLGYVSGEQPEIIVLFMNFILKSDLKKLARLDRPLKLRMAVVNAADEVDVAATEKLYRILSRRTPSLPGMVGDDWMNPTDTINF